jgi:DNA polymerase III delta prime subunit
VTIENELAQTPGEFRDFLDQRGLVYEPVTQVDMLACALGSQLLLFAGPSGTGKSTAARALADFLVPPSRHATLDVRPAWTSAEDVVGQFSVFSGNYVQGPATDVLLALQGGDTPPVLIVEEANLSAMEAYLGPVISAASSVAFDRMLWTLHKQAATAANVPNDVELDHWPRVFGTVNVDSTAEAPAPKVSGRSCVVLLEPPQIDTALRSTDAITSLQGAIHAPGNGHVLFGDPRRAWSAYLVGGDTSRFTDSLKPFVQILADSAGRGLNVVSPRDIQRCVIYMSWHVPLAEAAVAAGILSSSSDTESAENALLHFVLPGLSAEQFGRAINPLFTAATPVGLLAQRLERLTAGGESLFGVHPDFWSSLS